MSPFFILRLAVAIILFVHSIPGFFNNGVNDFGKYYLNEQGFAPFGILFAWLIKLSHVVCAVLLVWNKYVSWACYITIFILLMGIIMIHFSEGWYVVGGGRNGMEFNFLLIAVLVSLLLQNSIKKKSLTK